MDIFIKNGDEAYINHTLESIRRFVPGRVVEISEHQIQAMLNCTASGAHKQHIHFIFEFFTEKH